MIQIHDTFVCKPGNAGKLAKRMKEHMPFDPQKGPYVLTDVVGEYHNVVMITNYPDLAAWEADFKKMQEDSEESRKMMEAFKDMNDMYLSGSRKIYKVW